MRKNELINELIPAVEGTYSTMGKILTWTEYRHQEITGHLAVFPWGRLQHGALSSIVWTISVILCHPVGIWIQMENIWHPLCGIRAMVDAGKYDYCSNMPQFTDEAVEKNGDLMMLLEHAAQSRDISAGRSGGKIRSPGR